MVSLFTQPPLSLHENIPSFVAENTFWQVASQPEVSQFIQLARQGFWEEALSGLSAHQRDYWFGPDRADFLSILPRRDFETVADLGCGAGSITISLAERSQRVVALDACMESLEVLEVKAAREGLSNVFPVHANATDLPLRPGSVDLAILNGVLERVGYAGSHSDVLMAQRKALAEVWRCLQPGGLLYIGIENRFGANYLLGAPDEHTNLRWVNVIPRRLANFYSLFVKRREFTAFTHSYWGLRSLLHQAGFRDCHFWCPLPTYREPRLLVDLEAEDVDLIGAVARIAPRRLRSWMVRLSKFWPSAWWRWIAPHYSVIAVKPQ